MRRALRTLPPARLTRVATPRLAGLARPIATAQPALRPLALRTLYTTSPRTQRELFTSRDESESVSIGPGYIEYAGPSPASDASIADRVHGVITYARLRDSCPCPKCIHPSTRQKTHTSGEAFRDVAEMGSEVAAENVIHPATDGATGEKGIEVHWPNTTDGHKHTSFYPTSLLRRLSSGRVRGITYLENTLGRKTWDRESLLKESPDLWTNYDELHAGGDKFNPRSDVHLRVLEQLQRYGLAVVRGLPTEQTDNKDCSLREFAETIGGLRNTFYGETWDVKSVVDSKNVAYTNLNLGLHMDLLYFALPPRFQFLHCLRNRVIGGSSYFVDSFAAAQAFEQQHPDLYAALQRNKLEYEYDNDNHYMTYQHPVLPAKGLTDPDLHTVINWSPPFQAPGVRGAVVTSLSGTPSASDQALAETELYTALSEFQAHLDDPQFRYEFTMQEGDVVLFDNQRVLHARTAFRDKTDAELKRDETIITPGEPTRWLKGCYLDGSTVWDRLAVLNDEVHGGDKK